MKTENKTELMNYESPSLELLSLRLTSNYLADFSAKSTEQFEREEGTEGFDREDLQRGLQS